MVQDSGIWHYLGKPKWPMGFADGHASIVSDVRCTTEQLMTGNHQNTPFVIKQDDDLISIP